MKILLLGSRGQVGWELQRALSPLGEIVVPHRRDYDFQAPEGLRALVENVRPTIVMNAAAHTAVDRAESETEASFAINAVTPGVLAEAAAQVGAWIVHFSTDYVFDGTKPAPYVETDACAPLSVYGRSKLAGEQAVGKIDKHLIFRTSWVHSRRGANFVKTMCRLANERSQLRVVADQFGAPTSASLIADVTAMAIYRIRLDLPVQSQTYHLTASGAASWFDVAQEAINVAVEIGLISRAPEIVPIPSSQYPTPARRPQNSRLSTERLQTMLGIELPDWRIGVRRTVEELMEKTTRDS